MDDEANLATELFQYEDHGMRWVHSMKRAQPNPTNKGGMVTLGYPLLEQGYLEVTLCMGNHVGLPKVTSRLP